MASPTKKRKLSYGRSNPITRIFESPTCRIKSPTNDRSHHASTSSMNKEPATLRKFYAVSDSPSTSSSSLNTRQQYSHCKRDHSPIRYPNSGRQIRRHSSRDHYRPENDFPTSSSHFTTHRDLRSKIGSRLSHETKPSNEFRQRYSPTHERDRPSLHHRSERKDDFRSRTLERNSLWDPSRPESDFRISSSRPLTTQRGSSSKNDSRHPYETKPSNEHRKRYSSSHQRDRASFRRQSETKDDFPSRKRKLIHPMSFKKLKEMAENETLDNSITLIDLTTESSGFALRLTDMHNGFAKIILKILKNLCSDDQPSYTLTELLIMLIDNNFHYKIMDFLSECFTSRNINKQQISLHFSNSLWLMRAWLKYTPNAAFIPLGALLPYVKSSGTEHGLLGEEGISKILEEVEELYERKKKRKQLRVDSDLLKKMHGEVPPDDFRQISVFPTKDDIYDKNPFVRSNLTNSAYLSTDHYLDVQFRLLREDFVRPLREGVHQFLQNTETSKTRIDGLKIYNDVAIKFPKLTNKGVTYRLQFDASRLKLVNWRSSKRLIFGNLVCLSNDNFQNNFLFASIISREVEDLKEGYIDVLFWKTDIGLDEQSKAEDDDDIDDSNRNEETLLGSGEEVDKESMVAMDTLDDEDDNRDDGALIESVEEVDEECKVAMDTDDDDNDDDDDDDEDDEVEQPRKHREAVGSSSLISASDMKKTYSMAESEAYFEAYRHVLAGLQETHDIPLRQYIVECRKERNSPRYLRGLGRTATYDFSCIVKKKVGSSRKLIYNVLDVDHWPSPERLGLDPSQVLALKSALTNELSIIQGPPGTGKTYVGLMIMKILLHNRMSDLQGFTHPIKGIVKSVPHAPILVVCYTNHALDQFLEGIAQFHPKGIVRVGGRGKVESLKKYNLPLVRRDYQFSKPSKTTHYHLKSDLENQTQELEETQEIIESSVDSILSLFVLLPVISTPHYNQLMSSAKNFPDNKTLLSWLGVSKRVYSVPENSFIVQEPLEALVRRFTQKSFSREQILYAVACTEDISSRKIQECLWEHNHSDELEPVINPDVVCRHLWSIKLPREYCEYFQDSKDSFEVRCAFFVLFKQFRNLDLMSPRMVNDWIKQKQRAENRDFEEGHIKEEADLVEEQRMLDEDITYMRVDQKGRNPKHQKPKRNVISAKMDQIFFHTDADDLDDGFQYQGLENKARKQEVLKRMKKEMTKHDSMSKTEAENISDIFSLTYAEKWKLYRYWVKTLIAQKSIGLNERAEKYNRQIKKMTDLGNRDSFEVLKNADVIAMTTTGAAKYRDMIYRLPIRIVIVEEAAEVLEAHIVTSMPQTTEHLILIGDHQQLKPSPTVYELALKYKLDISLFERMVKNDLPCSRLELQYRMRPRIADLIRPHIYKNLRDHESVNLYEDVKGVQSNVFFLSHDHLEDKVMDSKTKMNQHEADFMIGLCRYLLLQGYEPDQITILTAYVGQVIAFKKAFKMELDYRVRITAVDNFQGEENDIILLSLVRSNKEGKIGFLSIKNRVCVALSRAKKGFYCIGNFKLLKEKSGLWSNILDQLDRDNLLGEELPLQCLTHETTISVKCSEDFKKLPGGGCGHPCQARLDCGHVCYRTCHPDDPDHQETKCPKLGDKICSRGHKTKLSCFEKLLCKHPREAFIEKCGHTIEIKCYQDPEKVICTEPCPKNLTCGHQCTNKCGMNCIEVTECRVEAEKVMDCGHIIKGVCSEVAQVEMSSCVERCNKILKCGHECAGTCGKCAQGRLHIRCSQGKCDRVLCCGHLCPDTCNAVCSPCQRKCETRCRHSVCRKPCFVPCILCKEKCDWKCKHYECTKLCSEPCDRPPCNQPCEKTLPCKHPCIGLCGEPCPSLCRVCDKEKVEEIFFGDEDEEDARFVQLECKHIFTYEGLDTWMQQENNDESSEIDVKLKECPRCKTPIRRSTRYGNIVNKTLMMINQVRQKISGSPEELDANRTNLQKALSENNQTRKKFPEKMRKLTQEVKSTVSISNLVLLEAKFSCLAEVTEIITQTKQRTTSVDLENRRGRRMVQIFRWLMRKHTYLSAQESEDLNRERQRCNDILKLIQLKENLLTSQELEEEQVKEYVQKIKKKTVDGISPYSLEEEEIVKDAFKEIKSLTPKLAPGIGIMEKERKDIVSAIDLSPGHWFKCKNGHVYCIGECGGAMEESKCPECKEDIGGTSHKLNPTNSLASEMDGATRSTWDPNTFAIPDEVLRWRDGF